MADPWDGLENPRPLSAELRSRLEDALLATAAPRPLRPAQRAQLEQALSRKPARWTVGVAAAVVVAAVVTTSQVLPARPAAVRALPTYSAPPSPAAMVSVPPRLPLDYRSLRSDSIAKAAVRAGASVATVEPLVGTAAGGTWVTLTGTDLTPVRYVVFGNLASTDVQVLSATQLRVLTPPHAPGAVDLVVLTKTGQTAPKPFAYLAQ